MKIFLSWISGLFLVLAFGFLVADIDRSREEKRGKLGVEMGKPGEPGEIRSDEEADKEHEALHQKLVEEGKANLKEIAELMKKIQGSLAQKNTGEPTQIDQRDVVKKIQELIEKIEKG